MEEEELMGRGYGLWQQSGWRGEGSRRSLQRWTGENRMIRPRQRRYIFNLCMLGIFSLFIHSLSFFSVGIPSTNTHTHIHIHKHTLALPSKFPASHLCFVSFAFPSILDSAAGVILTRTHITMGTRVQGSGDHTGGGSGKKPDSKGEATAASTPEKPSAPAAAGAANETTATNITSAPPAAHQNQSSAAGSEQVSRESTVVIRLSGQAQIGQFYRITAFYRTSYLRYRTGLP